VGDPIPEGTPSGSGKSVPAFDDQWEDRNGRLHGDKEKEGRRCRLRLRANQTNLCNVDSGHCRFRTRVRAGKE